MSAKTEYTHRTDTGEVATRNSTRTFTHVVVVGGPRSDYRGAAPGIASWAGSAALAAKAAAFSVTNENVIVEAINGGIRCNMDGVAA